MDVTRSFVCISSTCMQLFLNILLHRLARFEEDKANDLTKVRTELDATVNRLKTIEGTHESMLLKKNELEQKCGKFKHFFSFISFFIVHYDDFLSIRLQTG